MRILLFSFYCIENFLLLDFELGFGTWNSAGSVGKVKGYLRFPFYVDLLNLYFFTSYASSFAFLYVC